jgi:hypothetical protein
MDDRNIAERGAGVRQESLKTQRAQSLIAEIAEKLLTSQFSLRHGVVLLHHVRIEDAVLFQVVGDGVLG